MPEIGPGAALAYTPVPIRTSLPLATSCLSARLIWAGLPKRASSRRNTTSPGRAAMERCSRCFTQAGLADRCPGLVVAEELATAWIWAAVHAHASPLSRSQARQRR